MAAPVVRGVMLARDEDYLAPWALMNALDFCDEILVLDNLSAPAGAAALDAVAQASPKVRIERVPDAYDTHRFVEPWAGEACWVLGVDGDEIYDPAALAQLRPRLLAGEFDRYWRLAPHTLHAWTLDLAAGRATGFASPPNRAMTKLFNFAAIDSWRQGRHERLHGKNVAFRPGYGRDSLWDARAGADWDAGAFRCLHLCFMPRNAAAEAAAIVAPNPAELRKAARPARRLLAAGGRLLGLDAGRRLLGLGAPPKPDYKTQHYGRGALVDRDVRAFLSPGAWAGAHPFAAAAEAALAAVSAARAS